MQDFARFQKSLSHGWQTWHNESVLAYVHIPDGTGFKLGLKDYPSSRFMSDALVGTDAWQGTVHPLAHTYDQAYTALTLEFEGNELLVETTVAEDCQLVLVTPLKRPYIPSVLTITGIALWNRGGHVVRSGHQLVLTAPSFCTEVYCTAAQCTDLFLPIESPYMAVELTGPVGVSSGRDATLEEIQAAVKHGKQVWERRKAAFGAHVETYSAMQTCLAWDTIFHPELGIPVTPVSRRWNQNWGGCVLFCWDTFFAALMQSLDNKEMAYCTVLTILNERTEDGFVPNFSMPHDCKSRDRSQPPVGSMVVWRIYQRYQESWLLEQTFEALAGWNEWFYTHRRTGNGLMAWGAEPAYTPRIGHRFEGADVHCAQSAMWESGADDSPMYVDVPFDEEKNILCQEDVGLTGMMIEDCRCLAEMALVLGREEQYHCFRNRQHELEECLESLWCEDFGMYLNRRMDLNKFSMRISPFHFLALFSSQVKPEHVNRMMTEHFYNPKEFYGDYIMPSISRDDPLYPERVYWRGRVWAPMNYLAYEALRAQRQDAACSDLAQKSEALLLREWLEKGHVHENYDPETGEGCGTSWSDAFYHWGGLLAWIALSDSGLCETITKGNQ